LGDSAGAISVNLTLEFLVGHYTPGTRMELKPYCILLVIILQPLVDLSTDSPDHGNISKTRLE